MRVRVYTRITYVYEQYRLHHMALSILRRDYSRGDPHLFVDRRRRGDLNLRADPYKLQRDLQTTFAPASRAASVEFCTCLF